jgi:hypothetical protein
LKIDFKNRLCSKIDSQNQFSSKVDFENCFLKIIYFGEGLISKEFNVFDEIQCLSQVFLKILKLFSRKCKNVNSFQIKNNLIEIFIEIDFAKSVILIDFLYF